MQASHDSRLDDHANQMASIRETNQRLADMQASTIAGSTTTPTKWPQSAKQTTF